LELARELGATHTVNSLTRDLGEALAEITGGAGVDYVVDTTEVPASHQGAERPETKNSSSPRPARPR
ncbi:MAG TPA: zinc-binding dehydrogenase, partial [Pirellulales bacterium]|nr:zinc-binding dehydrogenase [Pirellulales bacterium]